MSMKVIGAKEQSRGTSLVEDVFTKVTELPEWLKSSIVSW